MNKYVYMIVFVIEWWFRDKVQTLALFSGMCWKHRQSAPCVLVRTSIFNEESKKKEIQEIIHQTKMYEQKFLNQIS